MKEKQFMSWFNWRLILVHFVATVFVIIGARQFSYLIDLEFVAALLKDNAYELVSHSSPHNHLTIGDRMTILIYAIYSSAILGLLFSFVISLIISWRKKVSLYNVLIVFSLSFLANRLGVLKISAVIYISNFFGDLFMKYGLQYTFIINGSLFIILGLFLFFNKWTNRFIIKTKQQELLVEDSL